tara:strand:+ start:7164 stop:7472 length:309 start_codon:yes stop_codon:yes gene_type:complete
MNNDKQHREDTKYVQWQDGMHVMLVDLLCDYELALIENSLRSSVYFKGVIWFAYKNAENCAGVDNSFSGYWICNLMADEFEFFPTKLTRAQALYIATGDVDI